MRSMKPIWRRHLPESPWDFFIEKPRFIKCAALKDKQYKITLPFKYHGDTARGCAFIQGLRILLQLVAVKAQQAKLALWPLRSLHCWDAGGMISPSTKLFLWLWKRDRTANNNDDYVVLNISLCVFFWRQCSTYGKPFKNTDHYTARFLNSLN